MKDIILTEGGRPAGIINYKDFISAAPEWRVEKNDVGKIIAPGIGQAVNISQYIRNSRERGQEAFYEATKAIRATEKEMLNRKPNELQDIINANIDTYITKYFKDEKTGKSAYDALLDGRELVKQKGYSDDFSKLDETLLLVKIHQAAFAEAIVHKYFAEKLKVANDRRSGLKRALNNMSDADKAEIKAWLQDHVTGIKFIVPYVDSDADISITDKDGLEDADKTAEVINKLNSISSGFKANYPNAKEGTDFVYRHTAKESDPRKDLWNLGALVTFDTKVADVPEKIRILIQDAKRQSTQETKSMADMADEYSVSSVPLAQVILKLFDNDLSFYKNKRTTLADGSDELINDYDYNK